ncbi:TIGR02646 family protein [Photobacterium kishitanii]|uniref:retron system putative HNH endonuclease n=1 Tax=Photobacterium kishitanii TaxID=318456 RepID=UPI000D16366A|nr:retron system putative HNH endonuclease [Photobacterium kishitanii]PSU88919.1 TIGR02646 family protein [Photobacterium kishitanii]
MIKLEREAEPQIMISNKAQWQKDLQDAIAVYGKYKDIPKIEKKKLTSFYRNDAVREGLIKSSEGKCAFCECIPSEGGNIEIEHFKPKSEYPELTFEWDNFLPSCRKCNGSKGTHDTVLEPIINPYDTDPNNVFHFVDIEIKASNTDMKQIAEKTIEVCGLNTLRLWKPRAEILLSLRIFTKAIEEAIEELTDADTQRKKEIRINKLREAIDTIEMLTNSSEKYSSFCSDFLRRSEVYLNAKSLVKDA